MAVDGCSRWTYREMHDEHITYSSKDFLEELIKNAPFLIKEVQANNGTEFKNMLIVTKRKRLILFEGELLKLEIIYNHI